MNFDKFCPILNLNLFFSKTAEELATLLSKMCLRTTVVNENELDVEVPPTRHDVIHATDVYEDAAIAFGYNNIKRTIPHMVTVAEQFPLNKLTEQLRDQIAQAGFTEALTFTLCSRDDVADKMNKKIDDIPAVHISNPKTLEFQVSLTFFQ